MKRKKDQYQHIYSDKPNQTGIPVHTDLYHLYSDADAVVEELLASCRDFKPLEQHARHFLRLRQARSDSSKNQTRFNGGLRDILGSIIPKQFLPKTELSIHEREFNLIIQQLELFVRSGYMISPEMLQNKVESAVSNPGVTDLPSSDIGILGIPTRNRANRLKRCLESYLEHPQGGRQVPNVHIVDDSDNTETLKKNQQAIKTICDTYETNVRWFDKSHRLHLVERLSEVGEAPKDIIHFAILGDSSIHFKAGASRNTLLLLAAGSRSVQVDDDTVNKLASAFHMQDGLALSTEEAQQIHFFHSRNEISRFTKQQGASNSSDHFFSLHNNLLGKHPARLIEDNDPLHLEGLRQDGLLKSIQQPGARIAITFLGAFGDSGMNQHWHRLLIDENSYQQLVQDEAGYRNCMRTRLLFRYVPCLTIGDTAYCMGMNMGLDTRRLLPPFTPVLRNEDGTFGLLLHRYFPKASKGYLPYAIRHDPPGRDVKPDMEQALSVKPLRTNDILIAILFSLSNRDIGLGDDSAENLTLAGEYLRNLGEAPVDTFAAKLKEYCTEFIQLRITTLQRQLNKRIDAPEFWKRDVRTVVENLKSLRNNRDVVVPADLEGDNKERLEQLQALLKKYGNLLIYWPTIWDAAVSLNNSDDVES